MWTPSQLLPEMTSLGASVVTAPMVLAAAPFSINTPSKLGTGYDPVASVPIKSPATTLPVVPESEINTPLELLPAITSPAPEPEALTPMMLLVAPS